jgi:hypothetical protein
MILDYGITGNAITSKLGFSYKNIQRRYLMFFNFHNLKFYESAE